MPIRPYAVHIRERVFSLLESLGFSVERERFIPSKLSNREVRRRLEQIEAELLLIPFNAHRDSDGQPVNGLEVLALVAQVPALAEVPIVMPLSPMGEAAHELLLSRVAAESGVREVLARTILLRTTELPIAGTAAGLAEKLAPWFHFNNATVSRR
jgi:hypothetical protein